MVIDGSTEFGARVAAHLTDDAVVWLTSVSPRGAPLPMPVWFLWDGDESVVVYSQPGGDIVVLAGTATLDREGPGADDDPACRAGLERLRGH